ncbi:hypothetical protein SAMN05880556_11294 [Azospirillum sp. RU38E]|nr:hypothetical protein SAMN05880556_11294 [Azospirillum sp. RU38E]SNS98589.1 hypothetical protein SAMN05880591_11294 [Azospirillum sp. RU37A]
MVDARQWSQMFTRSRRAFFGAAVGLGAGFGMKAAPARATMARQPISWVHGNSATVVDAQGLERDRVEDNARVVHGRSWSRVPLHFAVPSLALDTGSGQRVTAIWIRFKAEQGALISAMTLHDCERTLTHRENLALQHVDWDDVRIALDPPCLMSRSLGLTLECSFSDVARQISISAIGCEFGMTV